MSFESNNSLGNRPPREVAEFLLEIDDRGAILDMVEALAKKAGVGTAEGVFLVPRGGIAPAVQNEIPKNPDGDQIEAAIVAAGKTGPRITLQAVEDAISSAWFFTAGQGAHGTHEYREGNARDGQDHYKHPDGQALDLLTFCVLVLKNGFTVTGQSACADPANYDREIGESIARKNAVAQIWPLLGFALREKLHRGETDDVFDPLTTAQEKLAIDMSNEIAGGSRPDPVALLELADKLYAVRAR